MNKAVIYPYLSLGLAHGLADAASGFLLFSQGSFQQMGLLFLSYNLIAFALQPLAGVWIDHKSNPKLGVFMGLSGLALALLLNNIWASISMAAIGSAFFHVSGGSISLNGSQPLKSTAIFTAPGVLGLSLGTVAAWQKLPLQGPLLVSLIALAILLLWSLPQNNEENPVSPLLLEKQEIFLLLLITTMALRSFFWISFPNINQEQSIFVIGLGLAACLGKLLGGFLAIAWGERKTTLAGIALSLFCLHFTQLHPAWIVLGLALIQSSTPLTLTALGQLLPQAKGLAAGISLGFALALGGVPALLGWQGEMNAFAWNIVLVILAALFYYCFAIPHSHTPKKQL
jgi:hypothetical protein